MEFDIEKSERLSERLANLSTILNFFCKNQKYICEVCTISSLAELLENESDILYTMFLNRNLND